VSDPKQTQRKTDELDLEPETVKDLDIDETDTEGVVGGYNRTTKVGDNLFVPHKHIASVKYD